MLYSYIKKKVVEWIRRYFPAETLSIITVVLTALLVNHFSHNLILIVLFSSWAETIVFYSFVIGRDIFSSKRQHKVENKKYTLFSLGKNVRDIIIEFGIAEALDTFFIRPFFMYFFTRFLGILVLGIVIGKITSDLIFYIPTIIAYEFRRKNLK